MKNGWGGFVIKGRNGTEGQETAVIRDLKKYLGGLPFGTFVTLSKLPEALGRSTMTIKNHTSDASLDLYKILRRPRTSYFGGIATVEQYNDFHDLELLGYEFDLETNKVMVEDEEGQYIPQKLKTLPPEVAKLAKQIRNRIKQYEGA